MCKTWTVVENINGREKTASVTMLGFLIKTPLARANNMNVLTSPLNWSYFIVFMFYLTHTLYFLICQWFYGGKQTTCKKQRGVFKVPSYFIGHTDQDYIALCIWVLFLFIFYFLINVYCLHPFLPSTDPFLATTTLICISMHLILLLFLLCFEESTYKTPVWHFSSSDFFHLAKCHPRSSMLPKTARFYSFCA